jgi:UDP-N-acetylmuramoyl-L-alanyl-D-glutamate--2,6-diaminopimelate ligase
MKLLKNLLYGLRLTDVQGSTNLAVEFVASDSRSVRADCLFIAVRGSQSDGHRYLDQAIAAGARALVVEELPSEPSTSVTWIVVGNSAEAYAQIACSWFDHPSHSMSVVGVTGTNGKTTTATLLYHMLVHRGSKTGLISTVKVCVNSVEEAATHTTPDAWVLQGHLARMRDAGCKVVFIEVSSHGLVQHRVTGLRFAGAVFTNISRDHLDYHGTMDHYVAAKKLLFDGLAPEAFALVNSDDKHGETMLLNCGARQITYALKRPADIKVKVLESHLQGTLLSINQRECWSQLIGGFNAYNMAAMYGVAVELGIPADEALQALSAVRSVDGRFQKVPGPDGRMGIVDYAHTPDALENMLKTLQELNQGGQQLITVIGCGGDRDKGKRPIMAGIAADRSTKAILTSDNPRSEDPEAILDDMEAGLNPVQKRRTLRISDRAQAIKLAVQLAKPGDVILVAGKGHETYQEIAGVKHPFDDVATLKDQFNAL